MKKTYIQPEFELIRLTAAEDILMSTEVGDDKYDPDNYNQDYKDNGDDWE